jgi:hypothetical protein
MLFLLIFLVVFEFAIHARMPLLGHDNPIWFDQLIIGKWHFAHQGMSLLRYDPHICAGTPVYGNPESIHFSIAQILTLFIHPWAAMQISVVLTLFVGFFGWARFGTKVMGLKKDWSQLLALVMIANGFIFIHLAVGHFQMHTMPLLGWFLYLIFDREKDSKSKLLIRSSIFALLSIYTLSAAGYNVLLFAAITILFVLILDLSLAQNFKMRFKELFTRLITAGTFSLLACISKLVAVLSFMKFYPRIEGYSQMWNQTNPLAYASKAFWSINPTRQSLSGFGWDLHEKMIFLSPVTWMGLLVGLYLLVKNKDLILKNKKKSLLIFASALFTFVFLIELMQGKGILVNQFLNLPVIHSLRVASRFLYILSIFISILSIYCFAKLSDEIKVRVLKHIPKLGMILTLLSMAIGWNAVRYKVFLNEDYQVRTQKLEKLEAEHYQDQPVLEVKEGNTDFIRAGNVCHVELLKNNFPLPLIVGETKSDFFGHYNLINPSCYQYPEENNCKPGDKISVDDQENFENFIHGRPVNWKISNLQMISDYLSLASISLMIGLILLSIFRRKTV